MRVKWTRTALLTLDNAIQYVAEDRPMAAKEVGQKIWDSVKILADHPGAGRSGRISGTRELLISGLPFILPYIEKEGIIYILRVLHTSMKWPKNF